MKAAWVCFLLGAAACAARAEPVPITWGATGRFQLTSSVLPGKFVEVCGKLARGESVRWAYASPTPLDFNIHYHRGPHVVYPEKRDATARARGTLVTPLAQDFCWMWTHRGSAAATLTVSLKRSRR